MSEKFVDTRQAKRSLHSFCELISHGEALFALLRRSLSTIAIDYRDVNKKMHSRGTSSRCDINNARESGKAGSLIRLRITILQWKGIPLEIQRTSKLCHDVDNHPASFMTTRKIKGNDCPKWRTENNFASCSIVLGFVVATESLALPLSLCVGSSEIGKLEFPIEPTRVVNR